MRNIILLLAVLGCSCRASAKGGPMNAGHPVQSVIADTISFEWVKSKILVPVTINGKVHRFILDTGAPLVVNRSLARELEARFVHNVTLDDQSGKKIDSAQLVATSGLQFGKTTYEGVPAVVMEDHNPVLDCFGVDGFIGSNLLRNAAITFDLPARKIYVYNRKELLPAKDLGSKLKLDGQSNPFFRVSIGRAFAYLLFDSGSDNFFEMALATTDQWIRNADGMLRRTREGYGNNSIGFAGLEAPTAKQRLQTTGLKVNRFVFDSASISTTANSASRIGARLLHYGKVTLDYQRKHFYFEPFAGGSRQFRDSVWSLSLLPRPDGRICIGTIWDSTAAAQNNIHVGDEVLTIGNRPASSFSLCDFVGGSLFRTEEKLTLQVRSKEGLTKAIPIFRQ